MKTTCTERVQKIVTVPVTLYQLTNNKAQRLGLSFEEYIKFLLVSEVKKSKEALEESKSLFENLVFCHFDRSERSERSGEIPSLVLVKGFLNSFHSFGMTLSKVFKQALKEEKHT